MNLIVFVYEVKLLYVRHFLNLIWNHAAKDTHCTPALVGRLVNIIVLSFLTHLKTKLCFFGLFIILEMVDLFALAEKEMDHFPLYLVASELNISFWLS